MSNDKNYLKHICNFFSNHSKQWKLQLSFIEDLAKANDIEFDKTQFKRPRRKIRNFKLFWPQSDAAEYIARKLYEKRMVDPLFFKPWAASWLSVDMSSYEKSPFYYVPIIELPDSDFNIPHKLRVFIFSSKPGQDVWLQEDSHFKIIPICKTCHHTWKHYPSFKIKSGAYQNPHDTFFYETEGGKMIERLICPNCHSSDIYKAGHALMNDLERFVNAQKKYYSLALSDIHDGKKLTCWMWCIFPQIIGLDSRISSYVYGITGVDEAKEYLQHPILGYRLKKISTALLDLKDKKIDDILFDNDAMEVKSSMTLFDVVSPNDVFNEVLIKFFNGERDSLTLNRIASDKN